MKRLWVHGAMHLYYNCLADDKDKFELFQVVLKTTQAKMKENFSDLFRSFAAEWWQSHRVRHALSQLLRLLGAGGR